MSVIGLKAGLIAQISEVEDEAVLLQIKALLEEAIDWEDRMTPEQEAEMRQAIAESEDEENLISHEEVMKQAREWLRG